MAILNYIEEIEVKRIPVEFQCDVCKAVYKLEDEYNIKYNADVKEQMAVVSYSYPAGNWGNYEEESEIHCCSNDCLAKAIKKVPFSAHITIPVDGFYKR